MDNEQIKQMLLQIEDSKLDFTVTMTGKESTRVNGLYKPETREILLHNKNFKSDMQLIYTAIHEYTHHLLNEEQLEATGMPEIVKYLFSTSKDAVFPPRRQLTTAAPTFICFDIRPLL